MIITIDGLAGTGKSVVAKKLSKELGITFFDTGALYRSVAYTLMKNKVDINNASAIKECLVDFDFKLEEVGSEKRYIVNGEDVTNFIREPEISSCASKIAILKFVRETLLPIQRSYAKQNRAVFEGRDMGTVVFPDADFKFFLKAKCKERARRRYKELVEKNYIKANPAALKEIQKEMKLRDKRDAKRKISPVKKPKDAFVIDTTRLSIDEVVQSIVKILKFKNRKSDASWFYRFCRFLVWLKFKLFYKMEVRGLAENLYPGAAIIAANHTSFLDPPAIGAAWKRGIHYLARATLFDVPILGFLLKKYNVHPLERGGVAAALRTVSLLLSQGKQVVIFPEGTRSSTDDIGDLKAGIGLLAIKNNVPVIPVYIHGAYQIWNRHRKLPKMSGKLIINVGKPIFPEHFSSLDKKNAQIALTEKWKEEVLHLKKIYIKSCM